ncbi:MAG: hypothetical protein AMJ41_00575 [candidate division Zixibacteria bacterium DG_27]|nr:MAG: hypothetical protein AMJ41_00575 [candidate division Zixibacteria bacterium DG_27]
MYPEKLTYDKGYERSAHLYDFFDTKKNVEFFCHYGSQAGEIIDIGAGTGRIAIPMAKRGIRVFCVEPSPAMRREFQNKLAPDPAMSKNMRLCGGDATSFDLGRTFPAALLSGCFDHFLDDNERLSALCNINRHLEPDGKLVFDLFLGLMRNAPLSPAGEVTVGDIEYRRFHGSKTLRGRKMEVVLIFERLLRGVVVERIEERSQVGIIGRKEVQKLLKESGFEIEREFGDYDFSPYREGDSLLIIEAQKRSQ